MVRHHRACAHAAALFFVRHCQQHHIACQRQAKPLQHHEGQQFHDARTFVIQAAATPHIAIAQHASEGRHRPFRAFGRHHVHVMHQHDGLVTAVTAQACIKIGAPRCGSKQCRGDALAGQQGGEKMRRRELVARRIGGVYLHVLTDQAHRLGFDRRRRHTHGARTVEMRRKGRLLGRKHNAVYAGEHQQRNQALRPPRGPGIFFRHDIFLSWTGRRARLDSITIAQQRAQPHPSTDDSTRSDKL